MVEIAVRALAVRTGLVALAVAGETLVAASKGLAAEDLPAALSFCDTVMHGPDTTVAVDATCERSGETALPAQAAAACFRAGAVIRSVAGAVLGAFCVMDPAPRAGVGEDQAALLTALARLAGAEIEKGRPTLAGERGHETELSFRHLFEMSPNMMWVFDDETLRFLAVNEAVCERFGYSREEFLRLTIFDVRPAEERGRLRALRDGYDRQSEAYNAETWVFLTKTGERFQGELSSYTFVFAGRPARFTMVHDVTARRRAEAQLLEREASFRYLFDQNPNPMIVCTDIGLRILAANDAALRLYGHTRETLLDLPIEQIRASHPDVEAAPSLPVHVSGASFTCVEKYRRVSGQTFPAEVLGSAISFEGRPAWLVVVHDVSEQQRAQAQLAEAEGKLRQSQKLEAIGHLTGGIAHDFNNLLTVILGNIELLQDELRPGSAGGELLDAVARAAERGADLTGRLLAFARRQALAPHEVDVDTLLGKMHTLLARSIGGHIVTNLVRDGGAWPALVDPVQLETAVLNLVVNARDAMPDGGTITIALSTASFDVGTDALDLAPGDYVVVTVTDTGTGMTPGVLSRAFDPFFTTKETGKGSGLGLSMVYGFVRQSGGGVRLESVVGRGTLVSLYLPRAPGREIQPASGPEAAEPRGGSESVLVVEDDPRVRQIVEAHLRNLGYQVLIAGDGNEALEILNGEARIDLLLSDVVMPGGLNGRQLAEQAVRIRRGLRVLLATGYSGDAFDSLSGCDTSFPVLRKPYRRHELATRVRELLDSSNRI